MPLLKWFSGKTKNGNKPAASPNAPFAEIGGDIFRYELENWWYSEFSKSERDQIAETYRPMGMSGRPLIDGPAIRQPELHPAPFLANLATWVAKPALDDLALRVAEKALSFHDLPNDLTQIHFMFANLCKVFYRFRDTHPDALGKAIWACEQDIALSSKLDQRKMGGGVAVSHYCFKQLSIIEEKRGDFESAIALCRKALLQGWNGDWDKRISRMEAAQKKRLP